MRGVRFYGTVVFLCLFFGLPSLILATTWHIFPDSSGDAPTVQAGIQQAAHGDTVLVEDGTYYENLDFQGQAIVVASRFLLDGDPAHIAATIIDGSQYSHHDSTSVVLFHSFEDSNSVLMGLTITGGQGTKVTRQTPYGPYDVWVGGGVFTWYASPLLCHLVFTDNSAGEGGGVFAEWIGPITVRDCTFTFNDAYNGGALGGLGADVHFLNNHVANNLADQGAGLHLDSFRWTGSHVEGCTIIDNVSSDHGAGIVVTNDLGIPTRILRNRIENNVADMGGGGIYCRDSSPYIYRNVIVANIGQNWTGGGIRCVRSEPTILNNTLHANGSYGGGGGGAISFYDGGSDLEAPIIANNIITDSSGMVAIKCNPNAHRIGYNNIWNSEQDDVNCDLIFPSMFVDPLYMDPENGDLTLQLGSPCIDTGIALWVVDEEIWVDLSESEYLGPKPDMGAFEYDGPSGVEDETIVRRSFTLAQNSPNPFNPITIISFQLQYAQDVCLSVFTLTGRRVVTLWDGPQGEGFHEVTWHGLDERGRRVPAGTYVYRLEASGHAETRSMVLVK